MYLRGTIRVAQATFNASTTYNLYAGTAPAHQQIAITGFGIYGGLNTAGGPGLLEFCTATSSGSTSGGGSVVTPVSLVQEIATTFQSTWITQPGTAPTSIVAYESREVNPQGGVSELWSQNDWYVVKGGGFWVMQFTPQATTTYCAWLRIAE